ncbi:damage-inducible protein DinB [Bryobacterales bacterium F-183]|nr:damage-inducible protein DinB [Bryobacterales bacterium F-183]
MPDLDPLLLEWFRRNATANANLLQLLTPADFSLPFNPGSRTIGDLLAHMVFSRTGWLRQISPPHAEGIPQVSELGWQGGPLLVHSTAEFAQALQLADAAALAAVQDALADRRLFPREFHSHPAHFLQLMIIHDASHRSQILAALRLAANRTPEQTQALEDAVWDPWFT